MSPHFGTVCPWLSLEPLRSSQVRSCQNKQCHTCHKLRERIKVSWSRPRCVATHSRACLGFVHYSRVQASRAAHSQHHEGAQHVGMGNLMGSAPRPPVGHALGMEGVLLFVLGCIYARVSTLSNCARFFQHSHGWLPFDSRHFMAGHRGGPSKHTSG